MNYIKKLLNSNYFIGFVYLFTVICWYYQKQNIAILFYLLCAICIIIFDANRINIATLIMAGIINYRDTTFSANFPLFLASFLVIIPFVLYDFFKNGIKFDIIFKSMFLIFIVSVLSLINVNKETLSDSIIGVLQTGAFALIYLYFVNKRQNDDYEYIAKNALALGIAIALEFVIYIITYDGNTLGKDIDLGWGISNVIAMIEMMVIPLIIYLYSQNQNRMYLLLSVIIAIVVIALTLSKGAYLALSIISIPLVIVTYLNMPNRKKFIYDISYCLVILSFIIYITSNIDLIREGFIEYFSKMNDRGWFKDQSRIKIYKIGLETFLKNPLLGAGSYTGGYYLGLHGFKVTTYHNYVVQILATIGLFGFISFCMYLFYVIKKIFTTKHHYNLSIFFVIIAISLHGLVDNTWFNPIIMVIISIFFSTIISKKSIQNKKSTYNNINL
ncbi:MAG TPA: O-antigen ligase family protein [Acholeplasmataceae bacterium]|nr:O-antigen ligase family protein [Acholeplasmataceae bacterium]